MNFPTRLLFALPALALTMTLAPARDAAACGGLLAPPSQTTEVTSHRMALSISQTQSTLWDEIQYTGSPSSFAWVLPIQGTITVGVSSDALFAELDQLTAVTVSAPFSPSCNCSTATSSSSGGSSSGGAPPVTVVSQAVVGPYETVQLASTDPTALTDWLTTNGYAIPADITPIIAAYVSGGFNFLALKLVPGTAITAMQPVRVTTPGASPVLPLRMVAAGTGASVPITLFVAAEGRYEPTNFSTFTIPASALVWDFGTETSNYTALRTAGFAAGNGQAWLIESAMPIAEQSITSAIDYSVQQDPVMSGYADSMGNGAPAAAMADLDTLFSGLDPSSFWITRLLAEMPRAGLATDLTLGASTDQTTLSNLLTAPNSINVPPCSCGAGGGFSTSSSGAGGGSASGTGGTGGGTVQGGSSCSAAGPVSAPLGLGGVLAALALAAARRRRSREEACSSPPR